MEDSVIRSMRGRPTFPLLQIDPITGFNQGNMVWSSKWRQPLHLRTRKETGQDEQE